MQMGARNSACEMSLIELLTLIYQKKILLVLTMLLGLALGFAVIYFSPPVYEATIKLSAASEGDVAGFNLGRSWDSHSPLKPIKPRDIYLIFTNELLSDAVKTTFFNQFYLPSLSTAVKQRDSTQQLYQTFIKRFAIVENPKATAERFAKYTVAIRGDNAQQVTLWLQQFIDLVRTQTLAVALNNVQQQNAVLIANVQQQIDMAREAARTMRHDQIAKLKQRIHLAQLASQNGDDLFNSAVNSRQPPSPELLRAKINALSARQSDDAFIPKLRGLQAQLGYYQSLSVKPDAVAVFHVDGNIVPPTQTIAPKQRLILISSLVSGFLFGLLIIMLQIAWRREQERKQLAIAASA